MKNKIKDLKVRMPRKLLQELDVLVRAGIYPNRNDAIRDAIRANIRESG